jgi:hypothetical protein
MSRPRADTIPAVTVPQRPNGLPTATTQSPTRGGILANSTKEKLSVCVDFDHGEVGHSVDAHDFGRVSRPIVCLYLDGFCMIRHMIVRHREAVGGNEESGTFSGNMTRRCPGRPV